MSNVSPIFSPQVAIIGAGPYGLAAAAHLRAANVALQMFGEPMEFWRCQMPAGMCLRSIWEASHISDPNRLLTLDRYQAACETRLPTPIPIADFINYGTWFQHMVAPDLDHRRVIQVDLAAHGYRLQLHDGDELRVKRLIIAAGIGSFARRPPLFEQVPASLVSHTSEHSDFSRFRGQQILIIGAGQSALESAALLSEAGACVEVLVRAPVMHWLDQKAGWLKSRINPLRWLLYHPTDVGPPGLNRITATPRLFMRLPEQLRQQIEYRSIRPAGAAWLRPRLGDVRITLNRQVLAAQSRAEQIQLSLSDGSERRVDHVLLATGYQVDITRYPFLSPEIVQSLRLANGYPVLDHGFESSLPGLYFMGAPAAGTFGPLCRFVSGTGFSAGALTRALTSRLND